MSGEFNERTVQHVAHLARLKLSDEVVTTAAAHLSHVVDYMKLLNEVDTEDVPETARPIDAVDVMRDDVGATRQASALSIGSIR